MGTGPGFNYLEPENYDARKVRAGNYKEGGQEAAIKDVAELFNKDRIGFKIITRIAEREITVDVGIKDIKDMLSAYRNNIGKKKKFD